METGSHISYTAFPPVPLWLTLSSSPLWGIWGVCHCACLSVFHVPSFSLLNLSFSSCSFQRMAFQNSNCISWLSYPLPQHVPILDVLPVYRNLSLYLTVFSLLLPSAWFLSFYSEGFLPHPKCSEWPLLSFRVPAGPHAFCEDFPPSFLNTEINSSLIVHPLLVEMCNIIFSFLVFFPFP